MVRWIIAGLSNNKNSKMEGKHNFENRKFLIDALCEQETISSKKVAKIISILGSTNLYLGDSIIARQGIVGDRMYYILSGAVEVHINGQYYHTRRAGQLVGEMAMLEPGSLRTADLIAVGEETYIHELTHEALLKVERGASDFWKLMYKTLARRLRQRDALFVPLNNIAQVFVASSNDKGAKKHGIIESTLKSASINVLPWDRDGSFKQGIGFWEQLNRHAQSVDFAIILVTVDDNLKERDQCRRVPRDNVLLELGLFSGSLGRERTFLLVQNNKKLKLPSDLDGVMQHRFNSLQELKNKLDLIRQDIDRLKQMQRLRRN